jgi:hypothetical protein
VIARQEAEPSVTSQTEAAPAESNRDQQAPPGVAQNPAPPPNQEPAPWDYPTRGYGPMPPPPPPEPETQPATELPEERVAKPARKVRVKAILLEPKKTRQSKRQQAPAPGEVGEGSEDQVDNAGVLGKKKNGGKGGKKAG